MERIGVIGLGRMGSAIALRMQDQGYEVLGWTRSGTNIVGITSAPELAALVANSDVLILSLFDDTAVASVLDALLDFDLTGKQIIETSTVVPAVLKDRIASIEAKGAGAVLAGISSRIFHVGPLGTGLVMKTINNAMLQCYFNGLGELMPLAKRSGLPMETAMRIMAGGPAGMPFIVDRLPKILGEDDTVGFTINAGKKDNDVFQRVVQSYGLAPDTLKASGTRLELAINAGLGEADPAALVRFAYDAV